MIRFGLASLFLGLSFLFGIFVWVGIWLVGLFSKKSQEISLWYVQKVFACILRISGAKVTVVGREQIPRDTAVLYVGNHRSFFDILLVYTQVPGLTGIVAKKEMEKLPFLSTWMQLVNCLFLDRKDLRQGFQVILEGIEKLKSGISVCIFPEGTRNRGEELSLMPFKEGSLKMAEKSGCPIVPVGINNTAALFENQFPRIKPAHVVIEFGEPILMSEMDREQKKFLGAFTQGKISEMIHRNQSLV
jgi:1-acyl-sn-glycerol-3-phosphate acyltransferase